MGKILCAGQADEQRYAPTMEAAKALPQHTHDAGAMWHGAYVAWLKEARAEALAASGLSYSAMAGMGLEMPVVSTSVE